MRARDKVATKRRQNEQEKVFQPREFNNSINSFESLLRFMLRKLDADLQALITGQLLVEIAVRLFRL